MLVWACPACGREFGKERQSHVCAPATSVDEYFAGRPLSERETFEAVRGHLESLGDVIVEPVSIGILFKRGRTFAELRPMKRWLALNFGLSRRLSHPRITRTTPLPGGGAWHGTRVTAAAEIDGEVQLWLTESYLDYGAPSRRWHRW